MWEWGQRIITEVGPKQWLCQEGRRRGRRRGTDSSGGPQPQHKGWGGGLGCMPCGCQAASHPVALRWHRYCHPLSPPRGQLCVSTNTTVLPQCRERCGVTHRVPCPEPPVCTKAVRRGVRRGGGAGGRAGDTTACGAAGGHDGGHRWLWAPGCWQSPSDATKGQPRPHGARRWHAPLPCFTSPAARNAPGLCAHWRGCCWGNGSRVSSTEGIRLSSWEW